MPYDTNEKKREYWLKHRSRDRMRKLRGKPRDVTSLVTAQVTSQEIDDIEIVPEYD